MPATESYLRNIKSMHQVFCLSAVVLLICVVWMLWADYNDEWRKYQRTALTNVAERDKRAIATIEENPQFQEELAVLKTEQKAAETEQQAHQAQIEQVQQELKEAKEKAAEFMRDLRVQRAIRDVARANYGLGVRDEVDAEKLKELQTTYQTQEDKVAGKEAEYKQFDLNVSNATAKFAAATAEKDKVDKQIADLESDITRKKKAINKIEPSDWFMAAKRDIMLWPIINGFNSPERIQQDWMPNLKIDLGGMTKVDRFDRCRTCHYSIDAVAQGTDPAFPHGAEKDGGYPHPYASHPRLDLFLTSSSPHPLPKFGCTVCHEGQGSGTSVTNASHTPNDPHEAEKWTKDHNWFSNHFWEHPMYPKRFEESGCIKCHINVVDLAHHPKFGATAPKVARGYDLVKTYGCFGCHEINGFEGTKPIGTDLRLEPATPELMAKAAADPLTVPGKMRKVGPSLRHLASKAGSPWVADWTEEPKKFRPTTRMPQFFHLTNQQDETAGKYNPVEIAAIAHYLENKSQPLDLLLPKSDYKPDAARGQEFFAQKGCAACHQHEAVPKVPGETSKFGPELSRVSAKLLPGAAGYNWLYTWIRDPQRHHPRTKMPNLFLEPEGKDEKYVDPAADIAAFLLKLQGPPADFQPTQKFEPRSVDKNTLDALVRELLAKNLTTGQIDKFFAEGQYPIPSAGISAIKGDEIELVADDGSPITDPADLERRKLNYIGRKTITRYGCYGCHDIPNFEDARPIGTALQDWGKKDTSRLAFEHIQEYAHHHGQADLGFDLETVTPEIAARLKFEPAVGVRLAERKVGGHASPELHVDDVVVGFDGLTVTDADQLQIYLSRTEPGADVVVRVMRGGEEISVNLRPDGSLHDRAVGAIETAERHEFASTGAEDREMSAAFFFESLMHHGRPGFLWQKLRQPRSYDYRMTEAKSYDDRLRMPKFPFQEDEIEAIATFILGLTAEPPGPEYLVNPSGPKGDWIKGEYLLDQYNCMACHMLDLPEIRYGHDPANDGEITTLDLEAEIPAAVALLQKLKPPVKMETGKQMSVKTEDGIKTYPVVSFHGMLTSVPNADDPPEEQEFIAESWDTTKLGDRLLVPTTKFIFNAAQKQEILPARGGAFAEWLVPRLVENKTAKDRNVAWQMSPPPLYLEGTKVQTPWLYNFLQNPEKIRHTTVLRMPRFNMSGDEAQSLANYFASADGAAYPYQKVPEREPNYLQAKEHDFETAFPNKDHDYLSESWKMLNGPVCIKCHFVGGRQVVTKNPAEDIRGPNLEGVANRLRSDWTLLWLYRPNWITPYTSMPQNFPPAKKQFEEVFGGDANRQTIGVRDALMNYHWLMERDGRVIYDPPVPAATAAAEPNAGAQQVSRTDSEGGISNDSSK